jgi:hypothetical protein
MVIGLVSTETELSEISISKFQNFKISKNLKFEFKEIEIENKIKKILSQIFKFCEYFVLLKYFFNF